MTMKLNKILIVTALALTSQLTLAETIWLDVRSTSEFKSEHIKGAVHLPHTEVDTLAANLLPNKDDEILVYCRSGGRAGKAEKRLKALGYKNVQNIGGLEDAKELKTNKFEIQ